MRGIKIRDVSKRLAIDISIPIDTEINSDSEMLKRIVGNLIENALSAFFEGDKAVVSLLASADEVYLPVIVIGEYRYGLRGSKLI